MNEKENPLAEQSQKKRYRNEHIEKAQHIESNALFDLQRIQYFLNAIVSNRNVGSTTNLHLTFVSKIQGTLEKLLKSRDSTANCLRASITT